MSKNILVIGGGGREHALVWKLAQSRRVGEIYVAPGNGGTGQVAENIPFYESDIDGLVHFAKKNSIGLTVVGPDAPLAMGIVDAFQSNGLRIFGPTRAAAEIESSKAFSKQLMREAGIPTAPFRVFCEHKEALAYLREHGAPIVVKASGLALGKGVHVCHSLAKSEKALSEIMLEHIHKTAGDEVIIEDCLDGPEISIHAFCDGKNYVLFPSSQDHKRIFDNDKGSNTGGMGTIAPVPWFADKDMKEAENKVVIPILKELAEKGRPFIGCLYPGLKMTKSGMQVLEFNARFGDPETQSYMRLLKTDLLDILEACADGTLANLKIEWHSGFSVCIVLASGGYPNEYKKDIPIYGIEEAEKIPDVIVFHAGTKLTDNELKTSGGRVLGVTATGETLRAALDRAYEAVNLIHFESMQFRRDIGAKSLAQEL